MEAVLVAREKIYDHIQNQSVCHWSDRATHDQYVTYCVTKDTILDTAETLLVHRKKGFVKDIYERYIEYYGVLQAVYMQQDAICALHRLFVKTELELSDMSNWKQVRELRNLTVGHPVGRKRFLSRNVISYDRVNYLWWPKGNRFPKSENVSLATVIDDYAAEAAVVLERLHVVLESECAELHR
jgi:hypothetical protein